MGLNKEKTYKFRHWGSLEDATWFEQARESWIFQQELVFIEPMLETSLDWTLGAWQ